MKRFQYFYLLLVLGYLLLTLFGPVDPVTMQRYHLSEFAIRMYSLSVAVPLAIIWLVALYGYTRFQGYTDIISKEKEGPAFKEITKGLMLLAVSLPATSVISSLLRQLVIGHPNWAAYTVIGKSYVPVIFQLFAFMLLAAGSSKLVRLLRPKVNVKHSDLIIFGMIAFVSLFTYVIVARPLGGSVEQNYSLPTWFVVLTIVIPFLFAWYKGGSAVYHLYLYRKHVAGTLYREVLKNLVAGLSTITVVAILIQILASISERLVLLNFTPLLIIVYALVLLYAVGFGVLARGARQLKKIEEV